MPSSILAPGVGLDTDTGYFWPVIDVDRERLLEAHRRCVQARVTYGLGAKAPSLNASPGTGFRRIDCSGYVRWLIWQAGHKVIVDGSVQQHDFVRASGFKASTVDAGSNDDDVIRIAFLSPLMGGGVGHVALIYRGLTVESHGGQGPNRRRWSELGWAKRSNVYVLDYAAG